MLRFVAVVGRGTARHPATLLYAGARAAGVSYSQFMAGLKKAGIEVDRKVLADLAVFDKAAFGRIVEQAKASLA